MSLLAALLSVSIAYLYGHIAEYFIHKNILHNMGTKKNSPLSFHFKDHHRAARRNNFTDKGFFRNFTIQIKTFTRNISLSAQSKKIKERELEKKYKKNLANLIGQDIIFFLINQ